MASIPLRFLTFASRARCRPLLQTSGVVCVSDTTVTSAKTAELQAKRFGTWTRVNQRFQIPHFRRDMYLGQYTRKHPVLAPAERYQLIIIIIIIIISTTMFMVLSS